MVILSVLMVLGKTMSGLSSPSRLSTERFGLPELILKSIIVSQETVPGILLFLNNNKAGDGPG